MALGGGRTCIYTGDVDWRRSSQEGRRRHQAWRRSDTCRHRGFGGFGLKTIGRAGGFGLKNIGGRFAGLGLKTRSEWFGGFGLKIINGGFNYFGPQNHGVVDQWTRGGISKLASTPSKVEKALGSSGR